MILPLRKPVINADSGREAQKYEQVSNLIYNFIPNQGL